MTIDKLIENGQVKIGEISEISDLNSLKSIIQDFSQEKNNDLSLLIATHQGTSILKFKGSLDTNTAQDIETCINTLLEQGIKKLIADLELLDYISSAGLRVLLATTKIIKGKQGEFRICNPNPEVKEVFDISGFSMIFSVFNNLEEAMANF